MRNKNILIILVLLSITAVTTSYSNELSSAAKSVTSANNTVGKKNELPDKTILFFMNPNGRPCQMQDEIITGMSEKLKSLANVTYVKTTIPQDQDAFYTYGIRSIPQLIIVDKNGKEIKRFSPGIHDEETIIATIKK